MKTHITLLTLALLFCSCRNQKPVAAKLLSYGIADNRPVEVVQRPDSVAGSKKLYQSWNLIQQTTNVPNKLGTEFGVEYILTGDYLTKLIEIEEVIIFPEGGLTNPERKLTQIIDIDPLEINVNEPNYFSYTLDEEWECKAGEWVFQVKHEGKILLEQKFDVQ